MRLLFLFMVLSLTLFAQSLIYEKKADGVLEQGVLVGINELQLPYVLAIGKRFLRTHSNLKISKLSVFVDQGDALRSDYPNVFELSFEYALRNYHEEARAPLPMAELLQIGKSATLRIRDASGQVTHVNVRGENVFKMKLAGLSSTVLFVGFERGSTPLDTGVSIFLEVPDARSFARKVEFAQALFRKVRFQDLAVHIRTDRWFFDDPPHPFFNRFEEVGIPPPESYFFEERTAYCLPSKGFLECVESHRAPRSEAK